MATAYILRAVNQRIYWMNHFTIFTYFSAPAGLGRKLVYRDTSLLAYHFTALPTLAPNRVYIAY